MVHPNKSHMGEYAGTQIYFRISVTVILVFVLAPSEMNVFLWGIDLFSCFLVWIFFLKV